MTNKILIGALVCAAVVIAALSATLRKTTQERERYKANQTALLGQVEYYQTENGKNAASVQKLTLTYDELKANYDVVCNTAKELGVKVKRLESATTTETKTEVRIVTEVRDSIVYRDGRIDSLLAFRWRDPWVNVDGAIRRDSVDMNISSTDTIVQIVHRVPHKWWFIKWGTKAIRQEVVSTNPHTKITYTELIDLK